MRCSRRHWTFVNWFRVIFPSFWSSNGLSGTSDTHLRCALNIFIFVLLRSPFCLLILVLLSSRSILVFFIAVEIHSFFFRYFSTFRFCRFSFGIFKLWRHQYTKLSSIHIIVCICIYNNTVWFPAVPHSSLSFVVSTYIATESTIINKIAVQSVTNVYLFSMFTKKNSVLDFNICYCCRRYTAFWIGKLNRS